MASGRLHRRGLEIYLLGPTPLHSLSCFALLPTYCLDGTLHPLLCISPWPLGSVFFVFLLSFFGASFFFPEADLILWKDTPNTAKDCLSSPSSLCYIVHTASVSRI